MSLIQGQLLEMLETVALALGDDFRQQLVFVGGCTTALFITDAVTLEGVRATDDVDLIVDMAGHAAWTRLQENLGQRGFNVTADTDVICRMKLGELKVDFMPDDANILGFTNRWYAKGIQTANTHSLPNGMEIRVLTPAMFIATKLEAYKGRGQNDLLGSRDAEDILLVVDGREQLIAEIADADLDVRNYIAEQFRILLQDGNFENFIEGNTRGQTGRSDIIYERFEAISQCDGGG